jgi:hypothetical protein
MTRLTPDPCSLTPNILSADSMRRRQNWSRRPPDAVNGPKTLPARLCVVAKDLAKSQPEQRRDDRSRSILIILFIKNDLNRPDLQLKREI